MTSATPHERNVTAEIVSRFEIVCRRSSRKSVTGTAMPITMMPTISLIPDTRASYVQSFIFLSN